MPPLTKWRIAICKHTKKEILQTWTGIEWMCLHNKTPKEDKLAVNTFKKENKSNS